MNRFEFMQVWYNDSELAQTLTPEDCKVLFLTSLMGSSDFTPELFIRLFEEYDVDDQIQREIGQALIDGVYFND